MRKIGIIGLGHVGHLLAHQLITTGQADELVLIDQNNKRAVAIQTDLKEAQTALTSHCAIIIQDYSALRDAQVLIFTVGASRLLKDSQMAELKVNHDAVVKTAPLIRDSGFKGVVLCLSDPNEAITAFLQQQLALPVKKVLGLGTVLETARLHQAVARAAHLSAHNVTGFVYGQHNGQQVFAWSTVRVNGQNLATAINGYRLDENQLKINADLGNWYTLDGLGYNASAVCTWAGRILTAIYSDEQLAVPAAIYQPQYSTYLSFPALIGRQGVGNLLLLKLYPVEKTNIKTAAEAIKQQVAALQRLNEVKNDND